MDNFNLPTTAWIPSPELMPKPGSTVSIVFIISQRIFYEEPSIDPIFPALEPQTLHGGTFWINPYGPGTVLACTDRTEWRDPSTTNPVWVQYMELPPSSDVSNTHVAGGVLLLQGALLSSDIFNALSYRLGSALNAQSRISAFASLPLAPEQWKIEVEELFKASIARILINVRDIARGAQAKYWGYKKVMNTEGLCDDTYKMSTEGWSSVAVGWSLWVLTMAFLIIILAIPISDEELFWEMLPGLFSVLAGLILQKVVKPSYKMLIRGYHISLDWIGKLFR